MAVKSRFQIVGAQIAFVLGCALVVHGAYAEAERNPDNSYVKRVSHAAASPKVRSHIALIYDEQTQSPLFDKNAEQVVPIASITKLMTAMVMLDAMQPMDEEIGVEDDNLNKIKRAKSRLPVGLTLTRGELLRLALMASENRAASALARSYPGGTEAMVAAMNAKARELGMENTRFVGPTGLDKGNVSTANDLVRMIAAARSYPLIRQYSTATSYSVEAKNGRELRFGNTNPLVRSASWDIGLSKTGYIHESGLCLVMEANIDQRPVIIVLLNSWGKHTRVGDANRIKKWMERSNSFARNT
jgi:D-alanyl-D-alanine endopeptidase (penicillin-binding protein 7)